MFSTYERVSGSDQPRPVGRIDGTALGWSAEGPEPEDEEASTEFEYAKKLRTKERWPREAGLVTAACAAAPTRRERCGTAVVAVHANPNAVAILCSANDLKEFQNVAYRKAGHTLPTQWT